MWPPARGEGSGASWKYSRSSQPTAKLPNELRSAWLSLVASDPDEQTLHSGMDRIGEPSGHCLLRSSRSLSPSSAFDSLATEHSSSALKRRLLDPELTVARG